MMQGHEKSDPAIVAMKPANKVEQLAAEQSAAEPTAAEPVEPRAGTKGNACQQTMPWAQSQTSMPHALDRIRKFAVTHPRWEPYAGKPHVRFCAGRSVMGVPTASLDQRHHHHDHSGGISGTAEHDGRYGSLLAA